MFHLVVDDTKRCFGPSSPLRLLDARVPKVQGLMSECKQSVLSFQKYRTLIHWRKCFVQWVLKYSCIHISFSLPKTQKLVSNHFIGKNRYRCKSEYQSPNHPRHCHVTFQTFSSFSFILNFLFASQSCWCTSVCHASPSPSLCFQHPLQSNQISSEHSLHFLHPTLLVQRFLVLLKRPLVTTVILVLHQSVTGWNLLKLQQVFTEKLCLRNYFATSRSREALMCDFAWEDLFGKHSMLIILLICYY